MPDSQPLIGRTFSHYRILDRLGGGGMGIVYRAHDDQLHRDVAVKVLPAGALADEAARKQFSREALALARLNHPNVETVFEFNSQDGVDYLVLELIPGQPLIDKLKSGSLDEKEILRLGMQLADGLAAAHAEGVTHRDLKPGNLFVTPDGRLKILDFGLATLHNPNLDLPATDSLTASVGGIAGTVPYMSPEQLRGQLADARSDIYSAGAVLFEMATGRRPHPQAQPAELMGAILHESPAAPSSLNPRVSPGLDNAILKSLEKEPSRRYQSARELHAVLESLTSRSASPARENPDQRRGISREGDPRQRSEKIAVPARKRQRIEDKQTRRLARSQRASHPSSARWGYATAIFVLIGFLATFAFNLGSFRSDLFPSVHALSDKDTIVLADFTNTTGDPVFDGTLRQGLSVQLEQSPFLSLVSEERIRQALGSMKKRPGAPLTPDVSRDLCQRVGSKAYIGGSIASLGSEYVIGLSAINCATGDTLAEEQIQAAGKEKVLDALGRAASSLRKKLGESLSTVEKYDTPLWQATTPSLDALRAYSQGYQILQNGDPLGSIPSFQQAIQLDSNFAMAYAALGTSYWNYGETTQASENTKKAYELRGTLSALEKFYIESHYYQFVTGDLVKSRQVYELWVQTYGRDALPLTNLSVIDALLGNYDRALAETGEAFRLYPYSGNIYANLVTSNLALNRLQEARAVAEEAVAKKFDSPSLRYGLYQVDFVSNDTAGMAQQVAWFSGKHGVEEWALASESATAVYSGRLNQGRNFAREAVALAIRNGEKDEAAGYDAGQSIVESLLGNAAETHQFASLALKLSSGPDVQYGVALSLAFADDSAQAQRLADELARRLPEDTVVLYNYVPTVRAQLSLDRHDPSAAIEALQTAAPYELGQPANIPFVNLYPVYVRGEAFLAERKGNEAAAEFQKILDHRGIVINEPIGALAHLGLARAYSLESQSLQDAAAEAARRKSRAAYRDFLTLWKNADPDIPVLKQAKSEFAKMK